MSMNIKFFATREVLVIKTNQRSTQKIEFDVWQTPTEITYDIMESQVPTEAYKAWVMSISQDEEDIFAGDMFADLRKIFAEDAPVGKRVYNAGKEHVAKFDEWVTQCEESGYTISSEVW